MKRFLIFTLSFLAFAGCHRKPSEDPFDATSPNVPGNGAPGMGGGATEVGPGGDNLDEGNATAWFADGPNRLIHFCVEVSESFDFDRALLPGLVEKAFQDWRYYFIRKRAAFPQGVWLSTTPFFEKNCTGKEDLTFYFGVINDEILRAKAGFVNPTAFPARRTYTPSKTGGWGTGFVWIAEQGTVLPSKGFPDWNKKDALAAIIRHEVAHTLGLGHIEGTILASNISTYLRERSSEELASIDIDREVFHCVDCPEAYRKKIPREAVRGADFWRGAWSQFSIRNPHWIPRGPITLTLYKLPIRGTRALRHHLLLEDPSGPLELATFSVHYTRPIAMPTFALKVFTELGTKYLLDQRYETVEDYHEVNNRYSYVQVEETKPRRMTRLIVAYNGVSRKDGGSKSVQLFTTFDEFPLVEFTFADRVPFNLDKLNLTYDEKLKLSP